MSHMPKMTEFDINNYDAFYEHHYFSPINPEDVISANETLPRVGWALDIAQEIEAKNVLDLGCLEGFAALTIAHHTGATGVGVDLSYEAIELAKQHAARNELPVRFYQGTVEDYLEKCDEQFDLVLMFELIEHVIDPKRLLKLVDKVLLPGGTGLISTPAFESPLYGMDDEDNKCHIRLYTTKEEDYEAVNKFGNTRKATSMVKELEGYQIVSMDVFSELIHARYTK